jgi:hypothetical protein
MFPLNFELPAKFNQEAPYITPITSSIVQSASNRRPMQKRFSVKIGAKARKI